VIAVRWEISGSGPRSRYRRRVSIKTLLEGDDGHLAPAMSWTDPSLDPFLPAFPILPTDTNVTVGLRLSPTISAQHMCLNQPANDAGIGSFSIGRTGQSFS
jgi:hypothetical protein